MTPNKRIRRRTEFYVVLKMNHVWKGTKYGDSAEGALCGTANVDCAG